MPVTTAANAALTEAQFEAQLRAAILAAFPWLPAAGLVHQKSFTFRFGKATVTVNGDAKSYALARADVLVSFQSEPLAIFELKRPGLKLTDDDEQQGLSYARLQQPRPPLVVVSNGQDVRTLETDSGKPWRPASKSQAAIRARAWIHGLGIVDMTHNHDGSILLEQGGQAHVIEPEEDDRDAHIAFDDFHPYLILSHLAGHALEVVGAQTTQAPRADPDLLVGVGSVPMILRRPGGDPDISAVPTHEIGSDLSVVCHNAGIVEPITWSLVRFFGRESEAMRDQFIDLALDATKPALLPRLDIALRQTSESADTDRAAWAQEVRKNRLKPFLEQALRIYLH